MTELLLLLSVLSGPKPSFSVTVPSFLASLPHLMLKTHRRAVTIWCPPLSSHAAYDKADSKATPPEQRPQEMPEKRPRGSSKHMRGPDLQQAQAQAVSQGTPSAYPQATA